MHSLQNTKKIMIAGTVLEKLFRHGAPTFQKLFVCLVFNGTSTQDRSIFEHFILDAGDNDIGMTANEFLSWL